MAQTIKLKRSATSGATPTTSQLELGEVAINTYDGKMYIKKDVGGTESIVEIGGLSSVALGGLSDVTISSAAADQLLQYNGSEWVNVSIAEASAIMKEYQFTATAGQSTFSGSDDNSETLSYTAGAIQVFLNGIFLDSAVDYTATNGTSIVLSETVDANDYLQVVAFKKKIGDGNVSVNTFTGDDSTTAFTLSLDPGDENNTRVFIDGVYQSKDNYSVSGTTLTFSTAPPTGTAIEVEIGNRVVTLDTLSDLDLPDDVKLRLGTDQDLQIYHDGSHSYIDDAGTGGLYLRSDNFRVLKGDGSERMIQADDDGAVLLYYDGSAKIQTSNDGVTVTGDVEATGEIIGDLRGATLFKAQAGEALTKGEVVYISGVSGNTTVVSKADADDASKMPAFGLVAASASSGNPVDIYTAGILADIDTSSFSEGDELFVSTTAGALTATAPTGESAALQKIGKVTRSDATGGRIFIIGAGRTNAVPNLDDGDIFIGNASNQAVSASLNTKIEDYLDGGTSTPSFASLVISGTNADLSFAASGNNIDFGRNADNYITAQTGSTSNIVIDPQNRFVVRTNDTERMRIDSSGRVGIGTSTLSSITSSVATLSLGGTNAGTSGGIAYQTNGTPEAYHYTTGDFLLHQAMSGVGQRFLTNNTEAMRITSAGNVGIGTTSPSENLHVSSSSSTAVKITGDFPRLYFEDTAGSDLDAYIVNNANGLFFGKTNSPTGSNDIMALDLTNKRVGIGTGSPSAPLDVQGSTGLFMTRTSSGLASYIENDGGYAAQYLYQIGGGAKVALHANGSSYFNGGNVGIGTASPATKLEVAGTTPVIRLTDSRLLDNPSWDNVSLGSVQFYTSDTSSPGARVGAEIEAFADGDSASAPNFNLLFKTATNTGTATEKLRIDKDGRVGIGTTSPVQALDVVGSIQTDTAFRAYDSVGGAYRNVLRYDNGNVRLETGTGSTARELGIWTAGTERIRVDTSGNVGIGTTSPSTVHGGKVLQVSSSTGADVVVHRDDAGAELHDYIGGFLFYNGDTSGSDPHYSGMIGKASDIYGSSNLEFYAGRGALEDHTNATPHMIIVGDSGDNGKVGIGTASPSGLLSLKKGTRTLDLKLETTPATGDVGVQFRANSGAYLGLAAGGGTGIGIVVDSGNKVGIGTIDPMSPLVVKKNGVNEGTLSFDDENNNAHLTLEGADARVRMQMGTYNNGSYGVYIQGSYDNNASGTGSSGTEPIILNPQGGYVGIGTTAPQQRLDVEAGKLSVRSETANTGSSGVSSAVNNLIHLRMPYGTNPASAANAGARVGIKFSGRNDGAGYGNDDGKSASIYGVSEDAGAGYARKMGLAFYTSPFDSNQSERLRINADGNVGIGTTDPKNQLHVNGGGYFTGFTNPNGSGVAGLELGFDGTQSVLQSYHRGTSSYKGINMNAAHVAFNIGGVEKARVHSNGNVGIGTSSPSQLLEISGADAPAIRLNDTTYNQYAEIRTANAGSLVLKADVGNGGTGSTYIGFEVDGENEAMRIDSSGNLLVGTTSNSVYNDVSGTGIALNTGEIQIAGTGAPLYLNRQGSDGVITSFRKDGSTVGTINTNAGAFVVKGASTSQPVQLQTHDGNEDIEVDPDGFIKMETAGYERLRIDASGNVGIGTTAPNAPLTVWTASNATSQSALRLNNPGGFSAAGTGAEIIFSQDRTTSEDLRMAAISSRQVSTGSSAHGALSFWTRASSSITEKVRLQHNGILSASAGIALGDGLNYTSANVLDDYEEGTFTPVLSFSGSTSGITYSHQNGVYIKIGRLVYARWGLRITAKGTSTGTAQISGFPFASESLAYADSISGSVQYAGMSNVDTNITLKLGNNSTIGYLFDHSSTGEANMTEANFNNGAYVYGIIVYNVA